jgi:hypothetical protein
VDLRRLRMVQAMSLVPQRREYHVPDVEWQRTHRGHETSPQVVVSERRDRVLHSPSGEVLLRIADRPIGFRR